MHMYIALDFPTFQCFVSMLARSREGLEPKLVHVCIYMYRGNGSKRDAVIMYCQSADTLKHCVVLV